MMDWLREFKWLVSKKNRWGGGIACFILDWHTGVVKDGINI